MDYQTMRSSGIFLGLILLGLFCATSAKALALITVTQSEVQEADDCYVTTFQVMNTSPDIVYDSAEYSFDLVELSSDIADLGIGYTWQEVWDAFSVDLTGSPEGEIFNGWTVSKDMDGNGRFSMTHGPDGYDIWTTDEDYNELVFTLSIEKKYFGPNHKLAMNPYEICGPGIAVITEDDELIQHDTYGFKVVAAPEPATCILLGLGGLMLRRRRNL